MKTLLFSILTLILSTSLFSQVTINRIYTDYNGWWDSGNSNNVIPDNTHNLLGFQIGVNNFGTGIDDNLLINQGVSNLSLIEYVALPVASSVVPQYIGVGFNYGGAGDVNPQPISYGNPAQYLTDGIQGLDLGTALFNATGTVSYQVPFIDPAAIGDGVPDIIVTQLGDPSATTDKFSFKDASNQIVGIEKSITFNSITPVGKTLWKFYTFSNGTYHSGLSNSTRDIRVIAYDFADFGITVANSAQITTFIQELGGASDQGFIAYNRKAISILPVQFSAFTGELIVDKVLLNWQTATEKDNDYFTVEKSKDGIEWEVVGNIKGNGTTSTKHEYSIIDERPFLGISYYRLSQTDFDGKKVNNLKIISINYSNSTNDLFVYPNPSTGNIQIMSQLPIDKIELFNVEGQAIFQSLISEISEDNKCVEIKSLSSGIYILQIDNQQKKVIVY